MAVNVCKQKKGQPLGEYSVLLEQTLAKLAQIISIGPSENKPEILSSCTTAVPPVRSRP